MRHYYDTVLFKNNVGVTSPAAGASVQVNVTGGGLATIYSDDGTTVTVNPLTADANGRFNFFVPNGRYDILFSGASFSSFTQSNVEITDAMDPSVFGQTPITFTANNTHSGTESFSNTVTVTGAATFSGVTTLPAAGWRANTANLVTFSMVNPAAARTYTIPDFGSNDTFAGIAATQTLTNKTVDISLNTLKTATNLAGHYPRNNGAQYVDALIPAGDVPSGTNCGANNFATGIGSGLAPVCAQPNFTNLAGTIASSQQNSATAGALGAIQLANDLGGTAAAPTVVAWHFGSTQRTLSSTAPTTGQVLKFDGSNIVGATLTAYTNWGTNSSCTNTGSAAGATQTCTITLNTTEADTAYKVVCGGTGTITGYPFMQGVTTKNTTSVVVTYTNGTSNEAVASGWGTIECILTR